ncbi:MAG: hypothetical protein IKK55_01430 [Clostridia bacterium]|nr:hypothetical protein [Clostridia bacterium]
MVLEKKLIDWVIKNKNLLFLIIVSLIGLLIRLSGLQFISKDMTKFLIPWFNEVASSGGLSALNKQIGDYNLIYQTIISVMTYLKVDCVISYKVISIFFDYILAIVVAFLVCYLKDKEKSSMYFCLSYTLVLFFPTVIINSAFWGQCDSIYTAFIVLMILQLLKEKYTSAFIFFGVSLAFKLQAIFVLPFILCYYFYKRKFSIFNFIISFGVFWGSGIVAFLYGRDLLAPLKIYAFQSGEYKRMYMNFPSFWMLIGENYNDFKISAILITFVLCGIALYLILSGAFSPDTKEKILLLATALIWTVILFLPSMHERYSYVLDIFLIVICFMDIKFLKYSVFSWMLSIFTYGNYLVKYRDWEIIYVMIYIILWGSFVYKVLNYQKNKTDFV